MRLAPIFAIACLTWFPCAAGMTDSERAELERWIKSRDKSEVHRIVVDIENDPLSDASRRLRPALLVYFEDIDYVFCLTKEVVSLQKSKKSEWHDPVWLQIIFASGDFVLQHPEQASDRSAYMIAGWESALRVYERVVAMHPKARLGSLDELVGLREQGRLGDYVRAHLCEDDGGAPSSSRLNLSGRPVTRDACATRAPVRFAG